MSRALSADSLPPAGGAPARFHIVCTRAPGPIDRGHNSVSWCLCESCVAERAALTAPPILPAQTELLLTLDSAHVEAD